MASLESELTKALKGNKLGWRQLLQLNSANTPEQVRANDIFKALSSTAGFTSIHSPLYTYSGPIYEPTFESTGKYTDNSWGTSMFDPDVVTGRDLENWRDLRAENQPWIVKAANGILKGGVLAGTTFISGTAGLLWGGVKAIADGKFSSIWDNEVTQAMNTVNQVSEEVLPNYYTKQEQEEPWYSNMLTTNFIFDKFIKNLGFTVGAALSGGIYTKGVNLLARGIGALKGLSLGAESLGASTKLSGITEGLSAAMQDTRQGQIARSLMELGMAAMEGSQMARSTKALVGTFFNAAAEGTVEAVHNGNAWAEAKYLEIAKRKEEEELEAAYIYQMTKQSDSLDDPAFLEYTLKLQDIEKRSNAATAKVESDRKAFGTMDLAMNIPILWAGDWVTFSKFYAGGWRAARNVTRTLTRATKEAVKNAEAAFKAGDKNALKELDALVRKAERTGYQGLTAEEREMVEEVASRSWAKRVWPYLREPVKEGNEEMAQAAAELTSGYYYNKDIDRIYNALNDLEATDEVMDFLSSLGQGIKDSYGDINRWEEGFIGALTGLLGVPTFGRSANNTNQTVIGHGKTVGLTGGIWAAVRTANMARDDTNEAVQHINEVLKNPSRIANFKHLIAQIKLGNDKKGAILLDDKMAYKDSTTASLFEDIMYFKKTGRMDLLLRALEETELFSEDDIQTLIELTQSLITPLGKAKDEEAKLLTEQLLLNTLQAQLQLIQENLLTLQQQLLEAQASDSSSDPEGALRRIAELEALIELAEATLNGTDESSGINELIENLKDNIERRSTAINSMNNIPFSPYIRNGEMLSPEEIKKDILKRASLIWQVIEDISDALDELDSDTGELLSDEQLTTLTWYKVMTRDWERRAGHIGYTLKDFIKAVLGGKTEEASIAQIKKVIEGQEEDENTPDLFHHLLKIAESMPKQRQQIIDLLTSMDEGLEDTASVEADSPESIKERRQLKKEDREFARKEEIERRRKNRFGIQLALMLNSELEVELGKEGNTTKEQFGKWLMGAIREAIKANVLLSDETKAVYQKALEDLKRIGEAYNKYRELATEFRKNPGKVEQEHQSFISKAVNKFKSTRQGRRVDKIIEALNFNGTDAAMAASLKAQMPAILDLGKNGLNLVLKALNETQQRKLKKAARNLEALNTIVKESQDIDLGEEGENGVADINDEEQGLVADLEKFFNDSLVGEDLDTSDDLQKAVENYLGRLGYEEKIIEKVRKLWEAIEKQVQQFEEDQGWDSPAVEEFERGASDINTEEEKEGVDVREDEGPQDVDTSREEASDINVEVGDKQYSIYDEYPEVGGSRTSKESLKKPDLERPIKASYSRTGPALSEFLYGGFLAHPMKDFYSKNKNWIPQELLPEEVEGFLKYIEAVWTYLYEQNNVRENIKLLKEGEEIEFYTDPELNEKSGTEVVLIRNKKTGVLLGSINSKYENTIYDRRLQKGEITQSPTLEDIKAIFDSVINKKQQVFRTVSQVLPGDLARGTVEQTVAEVSKQSKSPLYFAVYRPNSTDHALELVPSAKLPEGAKIVDLNYFKENKAVSGQVFWLVPGANNTYIPVLLYGTSVLDLMNGNHELHTAFMLLFQTELFKHLDNPKEGNLFKLLYLPKAFIHYAAQVPGKEGIQEVPKELATYIKITFVSTKLLTEDEAPKKFTRLVSLINPHNGQRFSDEEIARRVLGSPMGREGREGSGLLGAYVARVSETLENTSLNPADIARMLTINFDMSNNTNEYIENISLYFSSNISKPYSVNPYFSWDVAQDPSDEIEEVKSRVLNQYQGKDDRDYTYYYDGERLHIMDEEGIELDMDSSLYARISEEIQNSLGVLLGEQQELTQEEDTVNDEAEDLVSEPQQPVQRKRAKSPFAFSDTEYVSEEQEFSSQTAAEPYEEVSLLEVIALEFEQIVRMFPLLGRENRILIHSSLEKLARQGTEGKKLFGLFKDGIILLNERFARGGLYHESFHYAIDFLLTDKEIESLFQTLLEMHPEIVREAYGSDLAYRIALEEKGAEKFRMFMLDLTDSSIKGKIRHFFRKLKYFITRLVGKTNSLEALFYSMYNQRLADRKERREVTIGQYQGAISAYYYIKNKYRNQPAEVKRDLQAQGITEQEFDALSIEDKETLLKCLL